MVVGVAATRQTVGAFVWKPAAPNGIAGIIGEIGRSFELGEFTNAIETLESSAKAVGGGSAHDYYFLAMSYQRLGDGVRAAESFAKAEKWLRRQSELYSLSKVELEDFRAEAEALLGKQAVK